MFSLVLSRNWTISFVIQFVGMIYFFHLHAQLCPTDGFSTTEPPHMTELSKYCCIIHLMFVAPGMMTSFLFLISRACVSSLVFFLFTWGSYPPILSSFSHVRFSVINFFNHFYGTNWHFSLFFL